MNFQAVLADFERRGIRLIPDPPKLIVEPASRLTDEDRQAIRAHKAQLLAALAPKSESADSQPCRASDREEEKIDRLARTDGWNPPSEIPADVAAEIARIEPAALALGWTRERLWNFRFWPDTSKHPRALAAVMDPGDRLIELTPDFITIEKVDTRRILQHFYRADA